MDWQPDTIVALATPAGRSGIGVVRLSGPQALAIAAARLGGAALAAGRARRAEFRDRDGAVLDEVVATCFHAPHSYTAEDVVEISAHGAPVVLAAMIDACLQAGARLAEPGEFTRRAFLNGRLDLAQAEAVRDLIEAHTLFQARTAVRQLCGSVAAQLQPLKRQCLHLIARLEAGIDFADDDVTTPGAAEVAQAIDSLEAECARLLAGFREGRAVREGLVLAIVGRPNVGKSSLFNRLLNADRAIVTPYAGTTRDLIAETVNLDGIPLRLMDTAGIRTDAGEVERLGIERSWQAIADADLVLGVFDAARAPEPEDEQLWARLAELPRLLAVLNKIDLAAATPPMAPWLESACARTGLQPVAVSALTGAGAAELRRRIRACALPDLGDNAEFITNARHAGHLTAAGQALARAHAAIPAMPHEAILVDLYAALHELDAITGQTAVEDILGTIFASFCIGK